MKISRIMNGVAAAALIGGLAWTSEVPASAQGKAKIPPPPSMSSRTGRCAVDATPAETLDLIDLQTSSMKDSGGTVTVPVYWHVVTTASGGGNVSSRIPDQMNVLRDAYAGSRFVFDLQGIDVTAN